MRKMRQEYSRESSLFHIFTTKCFYRKTSHSHHPQKKKKMHGGILNREAFIRSKPTKSAELDSLRDEVKILEQKLESSATKKVARANHIQQDTQQIINARRDFNIQQIYNQRNIQDSIIEASRLSSPSSANSKNRRKSSSSATTTTTTGALLPAIDASTYYQDTLTKKQRRQRDVLIAQQMENHTGIFNSVNNLNLVIVSSEKTNEEAQATPRTAERDFFLGKTITAGNVGGNRDSSSSGLIQQQQHMLAPLPMISDSVFRDGMLSVLIGEGWTKDQALAALISTQNIGTIAAAKNWLKTKLKTGKSRSTNSLSSPTSSSSVASPMKNPASLLTTTTTASAMMMMSLSPSRQQLQDSSSIDPPQRMTNNVSASIPVRHSSTNAAWSSNGGVIDHDRFTNANQQHQHQHQQNREKHIGGAPATTMTSREMRDEVLPMSAFAEPPVAPPRNSKSSTLILNDKNHNTTEAETSSSSNAQMQQVARKGPLVEKNSSSASRSTTLPPINNNSSTSSVHNQGIRIKIRRPTDGKTIEVRRRFAPYELLSSVVMAFLSEQGEDATSSVSNEESEKAASFARLVSSTASRWAIVSMIPPKKAYDWTAMDRTTLEDAGIGTLGGSFQMVKLNHVKSSWRDL